MKHKNLVAALAITIAIAAVATVAVVGVTVVTVAEPAVAEPVEASKHRSTVAISNAQ